MGTGNARDSALDFGANVKKRKMAKTGALVNFARHSGVLRDFQNKQRHFSAKNEIKLILLSG